VSIVKATPFRLLAAEMAHAVSVTPEGYLVPIEFPEGMIVMLRDPAIPCPYGWVLCNGENGTPDLRGRFTRGVAVGGGKCGDLGGSDLTLISVDQMPSHTHDGGSYQGSTNLWGQDTGGDRHKRNLSDQTSTNIQTRPAGFPTQVPITLLPAHVKVRFIMKTAELSSPARPQSSSLLHSLLVGGVSGTMQPAAAFPDGITMMWRPPNSTSLTDLSSAETFSAANWEEDTAFAAKIPRGVTLHASDIAASSNGSDSVEISERHYPDHTHILVRPEGYHKTVSVGEGVSWANGTTFPGTSCSGYSTTKTLQSSTHTESAPASSTMSILPSYLSVRFLKKKTTVVGGSGASQQLLVHNSSTSDIFGVDFPAGMLAMWYKVQPAGQQIVAPSGWRICEEFNGRFPRGFDNSSSFGGSDHSVVPLVSHNHTYSACVDYNQDIHWDDPKNKDKLHNGTFKLGTTGGSANLSILPSYASLFFIMKV
jgi:hypothetical protein